MRLLSVYSVPDAATYLYALLSEREPSQNISHAQMPSAEKHLGFVRSKPYREWFLIEANGRIVGATYLSKHNEIGIFIFREQQGKGYGPRAIKLLRERHRGERIVANVNPKNARSRRMFERLGAKLAQVTYAL